LEDKDYKYQPVVEDVSVSDMADKTIHDYLNEEANNERVYSQSLIEVATPNNAVVPLIYTSTNFETPDQPDEAPLRFKPQFNNKNAKSPGVKS